MIKINIDQVSKSFNRKKDLVFGPWCFNEKLSIKDILNGNLKKFYNEDKIDQIKAFKCCEDQFNRTINELSEYVRKENNNKNSLNFYKYFISYWFLDFIHLVHYSERLNNLYIKKYKKKKIKICVKYKESEISFLDIDDYFSKTYKNPIFFSHFLLNLLLEKKPNHWIVEKNNKEIKNLNQNKNISLFLKLKKIISDILLVRTSLVYGFNFFEKLLLSLLLCFTEPKLKYNKINKLKTKIKSNTLKPPISDKKILLLSKKYLPVSFSKYKNKKNNFFLKCKNRVMLGSGVSFLREKDNHRLLSFKERGGKIISVQHGSAYGDASVSIHHMHEYVHDKFISWGQKKHENYDVSFQPLPSPQLRKKYKKENFKKNKKILLVSTSNLFFQPKYLKMRSFDESCERLKKTFTFLSSLPKNKINKIIYKDSPQGHFSEKKFFKKNFKNLTFIDKPPEQYLKEINLVVMNNYSTFFFKSVAMNIPTILICKKNCWASTKKAQKIFDTFQKVGILIQDPKKAAKKLNTNTLDWWYSKKTQSARKLFCNEFALSDKNTFKTWMKYFIKSKI